MINGGGYVIRGVRWERSIWNERDKIEEVLFERERGREFVWERMKEWMWWRSVLMFFFIFVISFFFLGVFRVWVFYLLGLIVFIWFIVLNM